MDKKKLLALLASYGRSVLGAAIALYISGVTDPAKLGLALIAGLVPVIIRYVNPNDPAFGIVADAAIKAYLPVGDAIIPKEYLDANKDAVENLVKAYQAYIKSNAPKKSTTKN
jgi:hypothetical protein